MAPLIGIDVSHHQGSVNWAAMFRDGVRFAGLKATEGDSFVDSRFKTNLQGARAAGIVPFAYHYQRSVATAAEQVANIARVVPRDCPVVPDVEAGSGNIGLTRGIVAGLLGRGYTVPLSYIPRWYWQQIKSPLLVGLPPLWSSRYPDNVIHELAGEYREIEVSFMHFWQGYGGLPVAVLQFTSSARVGGRAPIDGNAFRGTLAQFRALMAGTKPGPAPTPPTEEEDELNSEEKRMLTELHQNLRTGKTGKQSPGILTTYIAETLRNSRASAARENSLIRMLSAGQENLTQEDVRTVFREELQAVGLFDNDTHLTTDVEEDPIR